MFGIAHADGADEVNQLAETILIEGYTTMVSREYAFGGRVVVLEREHGIVGQFTHATDPFAFACI